MTTRNPFLSTARVTSEDASFGCGVNNGAAESSSKSPKQKNRHDLVQKQTGVTISPENRVLFFTTTADELGIMQSAAVRVQRRADVIAFQDYCSVVNWLHRQPIVRCPMYRISRNFDVFDRAGAVGSVPALDLPEESDSRLWPVIFGGNEATQTANSDQQKPDL